MLKSGIDRLAVGMGEEGSGLARFENQGAKEGEWRVLMH
jgi:hypothetical protein